MSVYTPINEVPQAGSKITNEGIPNELHKLLLEAIQDALNVTIYTVTTAPDATKNQGRMIPVSNETGGFTMAFSDGTNWRRVQDRAIIS